MNREITPNADSAVRALSTWALRPGTAVHRACLQALVLSPGNMMPREYLTQFGLAPRPATNTKYVMCMEVVYHAGDDLVRAE